MTFLVQLLFFAPRQFILQLTFDVLPNFQLSNASYVRSNEVIFQERYSCAIAIDSTNPLAHRKLSNVDLTPIEHIFEDLKSCFVLPGKVDPRYIRDWTCVLWLWKPTGRR